MKRKLYKKLLEEKNKKISIIIGPRQVGKTTLLKQLHKKLKGLYLDLDIIENVEKINTYEKLLNQLKIEGYSNNKFYLFLDEFQRFTDLTKILKNIVDHHPKIKIYATGSSSITIKNQVQESLAGRKYLHYLYPLDFEEFLELKNIDTKKLHQLNKLTGTFNEFHKELEEFLIYGGYPEVITSKNKKETLSSIFDTFIKKELVNYLNIKEIIGVKKLIQYIAINNGQKLNITDISQKLNLKRNDVENYLEILNETFIIKKITPYYTNKNKEIIKAYKEYFIDPGVRNYFCNNFNQLEIRNDTGFLFETFILGEIMKKSSYEIKYWQNKQGQEIDFIIDKIHEQIGLEIKYKKKLKNEDFKNLKKIKLKSFIINLSEQENNKLLFTNINKVLT